MNKYAHSRPPGDSRPWQDLEDHLYRVGELAAAFAPEALCDLARVAGQWHDIGKYQEKFQRYIGNQPELSNEQAAVSEYDRVPHAAAGAALALQRLPEPQRMMVAAVIEAHHGALKPFSEVYSAVQSRGNALLQAAREGGVPSVLENKTAAFNGTASALAVRMLFSALVDADLLDTEAWDLGQERPDASDALPLLRDRVDAACLGKIAKAEEQAQTDRQRALATMRRSVYEACVETAESPDAPPGQFTLTVPTGGGKTLSGLAFALHHAVRNGMNRVIVVTPYTSILEQTAEVYRKILGAANIIEHHSNVSPLVDTDRNRQACENWDAPVIVTTSVQLLESLHAAHKRPCRKLHRVGNSVVLLDEVQTFPVELLQPIHAALKRLVDEFHVTVVHGTATQPLLATGTQPRSRKLLPGLLQTSMREIMPQPAALFEVVRSRFKLEVLGNLNTPLDPALLAEAVQQHQTALVITHRRDDAWTLAEMLGPDCFHLSAAMCPAHRSKVLMEVRRRLCVGERCLLVTTQLIEAGVDIDFPIVYRALGGLDALAQAAGRCNREMRLAEPGRFIVYCAGSSEPDSDAVRPSQPPPGTPRLGMRIALTNYFNGGLPDLHDPALFPGYTTRVMNLCDTDRNGILSLEAACDFEAVAEKFSIIDEQQTSIVAPYGDGPALVAQLRREGPSRERFRALQRYTAGVHTNVFDALFRSGWIRPVVAGEEASARTLWCVEDGSNPPYDERFGFPNDPRKILLRPLHV